MNEEVESSADADVSEVDVSASLVPPSPPAVESGAEPESLQPSASESAASPASCASVVICVTSIGFMSTPSRYFTSERRTSTRRGASSAKSWGRERENPFAARPVWSGVIGPMNAKTPSRTNARGWHGFRGWISR